MREICGEQIRRCCYGRSGKSRMGMRELTPEMRIAVSMEEISGYVAEIRQLLQDLSERPDIDNDKLAKIAAAASEIRQNRSGAPASVSLAPKLTRNADSVETASRLACCLSIIPDQARGQAFSENRRPRFRIMLCADIVTFNFVP